jgi:hypothetical protein
MDHATGNLEHFLEFEEIEVPDKNDPLKKHKMQVHHLSLAKARKWKQLGVVKKITPNQYGIGIELHDPIRAIEIYAKVAGWIKDNPTGGNVPQNNDDELDKAVQEHATAKQ